MKSRRLLVSLSLLALALSSLTAVAHAASPFVRAASPVRTADAALAKTAGTYFVSVGTFIDVSATGLPKCVSPDGTKSWT